MSNIDRMLIGKLDNNCDLLSSAKNNFRYVGEVKMSDRQLTFEEWYETDRKCKPITSGNEKSIPCSPTDLIRWEREAWEASKAQEKREYELLESEYSELLANFCKVDMERIKLGRENDELKLQNKKAINAFKALNRYLCNGEHVDLSWIKDEIQLQAESESLTKSRHSLEIAKLKRDIDDLKKKLSEAIEVILFYGNQANWYSHGKDSTIKRRIDLNDGEEFLNMVIEE